MVAKSVRTSTGRQKNKGQVSPLSHFLINARKIRYFSFFILSFVLLLSCAEIGAPPGGPVDRAGPFILASTPADGSTNTPIGDRVTITFSESVLKPASGKALFISPRPRKQPKLKWHSDRLEVIFPDSFKSDQTYVLSLNNTVTDLRNNPVDSNVTIAFSTGAALDTGRLSGEIADESGPVAGMQIALFNIERVSEEQSYDSLYPDYLVAGNREGEFHFSNIPDREYRLVAFFDKDRNELLSPFRESFGVPDRRIIVGGKASTENLYIPLTSLDSSGLQVTSATLSEDGLLRVNLSSEIKTAYLARTPEGARLVPEDSSQVSISASAFFESRSEYSQIFSLYFPAIVTGTYTLLLDWSSNKPPLTKDSVIIKIPEDKNRPRLADFRPEQSPAFIADNELSLRFSEPIDTGRTTANTFTLWVDDTVIVPSQEMWTDPFGVRIKTDQLQEGRSYRLDVTEFDIFDLSGNPLGDSLTQRSFSFFDPDSLGTISGKIDVLLDQRKTDPAILSFVKIGDNRAFDLQVSSRRFSIVVPPGKYLLSGFLDSDDNGRRGKGSLLPFTFSETFADYPDTIKVRARFETGGIEMEFK